MAMADGGSRKSIQDAYPEDFSHCYGCGRLNPRGLRLESFRDGDEVVAVFRPEAHHLAFPGIVYGGLIASLIDCHAMATAAAAVAGDAPGPVPRFVTASLQVDYLRPTPLDGPLEIRARAEEVKERKVLVSAALSARGEVCARGRVVAVRMPAGMVPGGSPEPTSSPSR